MAIPIWEDTYVTLGTTSPISYNIYDDTGALIYTGLAYKKPSETYVKVKLNDICADYLKQTMPQWDDEWLEKANVRRTFRLSAGGVTRTYQFALNWSYDKEWYPSNNHGFRSAPITNVTGEDVQLLLTKEDASDVSLVLYYKDGRVEHHVEEYTQMESFSASDFNDDFQSNHGTDGEENTYDLNIAISTWIWSNLERIVVDGVFDFKVVCGHRYSLCYVNAYGGWDTFQPTGRVTEKDTYSRKGYKREANNEDTYDRRNDVTYVNDIEKVFTIVSGWLTDDEASRMHHLLGSNDVHLYDAKTSQMHPVTIESSECQYKTYGSEGNKMVCYTFDVKLAENRVRK